MIRNHSHRFAIVLFALASLLFAQVALAGYTCRDSGSRAAEVAAMAEAGMPCAESMGMTIDAEQPNLCHAHCQADQQTAHTWQMPVLASLANASADYLKPQLVPAAPRAQLQAALLRRTTAPPLAIQNCCFRI
jgi:hypothetical protein